MASKDVVVERLSSSNTTNDLGQSMSDCFDHEADAWESLDRSLDEGFSPFRRGYSINSFSPRDPNTRPKQKKVTCAFCGKKKLRWRFLLAYGSWRLVAKKGKQHVCQQYLIKQRRKRLKFRGVLSK